jgi:integrase
MAMSKINIFSKKRIRLSEFLFNHCNNTRRSASYRRFYRRLARLITEFEKYIGKEIYTDSFDSRICEEYLHFIKQSKPLKRGHEGYRQSTVRNFIQKTIAALNKASRAGYNAETSAFEEYIVKEEESEAIYLNEDELEKLMVLNLKGEQAQVRDVFLIGCCTALRYSDFSRLTEENFFQGNITITTKKTGTKVTIPIHHRIKEIIKRNNGYSFLKYSKSQQNFNCIIKRVCKKALINDKILIERTEGFKKIRKIMKKWEMVSTHTARRSGATNMYLANIPPFRIMLITGHKTETAFYKYIRIRKEENAIILQSHPFFNGKD